MLPRFARFLCCATTLALVACQAPTTTQRNTMIGAGVGALAGAGVAKATGGRAATGALAGAAIGGAGAYLWSQHLERQRQELQASMRGTGVSVSRTADNRLLVAIPADISFDSGSHRIKAKFRPVLNRVEASLRRNPQTDVLIVGHTDSTGNARINDPLSQSRADATRQYLFSRGLRGPRIRTEGQGARSPIASNATAAGRAKNRRVEIYVAQQ